MTTSNGSWSGRHCGGGQASERERPARGKRKSRRHQALRFGHWAEMAAVMRLRLAGWGILGRHVVSGRGSGAGEVDIVARRGDVVAFVEVKFRPTLAAAAGAISPRQQGRIARAARHFLATHPDLAGCALRFDAVLVAPWRLPRHLADAWRPE